MARHPTEDAVEHDDGIADVGSFVEHDALGPLAHGGVGHLSTRRAASTGKLIEYLGGPDDWEMRSLTQPEDLLLDFGEPLVPDFDGQVTSSNHHPYEWRAHRMQQDLGKSSECTGGLDLEDEPQMLGSDPIEVAVHFINVVLVTEK